MGAPIYEKSAEITGIIKKLFAERDDLFGDLKKMVWEEMIVCTLRTDKVAPKSQKTILKIEGIRGAKTSINPDVHFVIHGYKSKWDEQVEEKKIAHVANMLVRIDYPSEEEKRDLEEKGEDFELGKLRKPDIQEFRSFIVAPGLGVDWADEHTDIVNIMDDKEVIV